MTRNLIVIIFLLQLHVVALSQHAITYDHMGRMISNEEEEIAFVEWNNSNKIVRITRVSTSKAPDLEFKYDVLGNHMVSILKPRNGAGLLPKNLWQYTYYTYDALQHRLGIYERRYEAPQNNIYKEHFARTQQHIHFPHHSEFDNRIGTEEIFNNAITFTSSVAPDDEGTYAHGSLLQHDGDSHPRRGDKAYGLKGEQQSIKAVVTDRKTSEQLAEVTAATDYFPFGMNITDRRHKQTDYNAAFMSKEKIATSGSHNYDFGARIYSASLAKWLSPDAHATRYPSQSPYLAFGNSPLMMADPDGNDIVYAHLIDQSFGAYSLVNYLVNENDVFKNLIHKFHKPNILRFQLGTQNGLNTDVAKYSDHFEFTMYIKNFDSLKPTPEGYKSVTVKYSEIEKIYRLLLMANLAPLLINGQYDERSKTNAVRLNALRGLKEYVKDGKHAYTDEELEALSWRNFEETPEFETYIQQEADRNKITKEHAFALYTQKSNDLAHDVETVIHEDGRKEVIISPYFRGH